jgi:hypothetical protein
VGSSLIVKSVAVGAVVVALVSVRTRAMETLESGYQTVRTSTPSFTDRDLGSPPLGGIETQPMLLAPRLIPADATYTLVVGDITPLPPYIHQGLPHLMRYWLLPRRYSDDIHDVDWVITFHQSSERLGVPVRHEFGLGPDANAVEVAR